MPCFHPLKAYQASIRNGNGKRDIFFKTPNCPAIPIDLPCGQCIGCRLERSRQWAIRCVHESKMHKENCFITLTYNDLHNPENLVHRDFQLFMKRLRKKFGEGIRFYMCGEYGEQFGRPHYHACIFGFDFPDKKLLKEINNFPIYRSAMLEELWPYGYSSIGTVTFESAAYVARYIMKKINGDAAPDHYLYQSYLTGEQFLRKPEYTNMSRASGIGKQFYKQYSSDIYNHDYVVLNGKKLKPPKYYDNQHELVYPDEIATLKKNRKSAALKHVDNNTPARLLVREVVQQSRLNKLPRNLK